MKHEIQKYQSKGEGKNENIHNVFYQTHEWYEGKADRTDAK